MLLGIFSPRADSVVILRNGSDMRWRSMRRWKGCDAGKRGYAWGGRELCRDRWKDGRIGGLLRCCFIYPVFTVSLVS